MIRIIGSPVSPYVRKVLTLLLMKDVEFEVDPITPFYGNDEFTALSPLRRVPVFIDGDFVLNDSTVISEYIEERWPTPPSLPANAEARGRARWLDQYANSRMGDVFLWKSFGAKLVAPLVFKTELDVAAFDDNINTDVADVMDFLESEAPEEGFFVGAFSVADVAIATMFRNMKYTDWSPDGARWPKTCAWLARAEAEPCLSKTSDWSDKLITVKPQERRALAAQLGLRLTAESLADRKPQRGPMTKIG